MLDLVLPVAVLIVSCIVAMIYTGGFFSGASFVDAFANSSASVGLVLGGAVALVFTFIYYMMRDVLSFQEFTECIPEGFKSMIAPILILTMAWTLSGMTNLLGAKVFVADMVAKSAGSLQGFLPMVIFLVAAFLAFATGTSWGTFSILIPIVIGVFPSGQMMVISIASCLAGAVCGDHCSPISDTTIMASPAVTVSMSTMSPPSCLTPFWWQLSASSDTLSSAFFRPRAQQASPGSPCRFALSSWWACCW